MSNTYNRVSKHVFASKRDVEHRLAVHNRKVHNSIIEVLLVMACCELSEALDRMELKNEKI